MNRAPGVARKQTGAQTRHEDARTRPARAAPGCRRSAAPARLGLGCAASLIAPAAAAFRHAFERAPGVARKQTGENARHEDARTRPARAAPGCRRSAAPARLGLGCAASLIAPAAAAFRHAFEGAPGVARKQTGAQTRHEDARTRPARAAPGCRRSAAPARLGMGCAASLIAPAAAAFRHAFERAPGVARKQTGAQMRDKDARIRPARATPSAPTIAAAVNRCPC